MLLGHCDVLLSGKVLPSSSVLVGAIVGGAIGGAVAITAIVVFAWYMIKRNHRPTNPPMYYDQPPATPLQEWRPVEKPGFNDAQNAESAPTEDHGRAYWDSGNTGRISGRLSSQ